MKTFFIRLWLWLTDAYCWRHTELYCVPCKQVAYSRRSRQAAAVRKSRKAFTPVLLPEWEPVVMNKLHDEKGGVG